MRLRKPAWWDQPNHPVFIAMLAVVLAFATWFIWWSFIDDDAGTTPPRDTTSQPAATAPTRSAENPPQLPNAVTEPSKAGLEATVRFENDAINYAQRTGDTEPLKRVYDLERCAFCASLTTQFENLTSNGRYLVGASYTVVSVTRTDLSQDDKGRYNGVVELRNKRNAGRQVEPDGRVIQAIEASPIGIFERTLSFDNGAWRIIGNRLVEVVR
jgi:hypothetical protein